jgi:hypothetical protein
MQAHPPIPALLKADFEPENVNSELHPEACARRLARALGAP